LPVFGIYNKFPCKTFDISIDRSPPAVVMLS